MADNQLLNKDNEEYKASLPILKKDKKIDEERWLVVYTKSRQEKKTAELLTEIEIEAYCPTMHKTRQWKDRKVIVIVPMFTCYCFVKVRPSLERKVLELPSVSRFVYWQGKAAVVKTAEIELLKQWLEKPDGDLLTFPFEASDRALIKSGVFMGKEGVIMHKSGNQITLWIEELGIKIVSTLKQIVLEKIEK